MRREIGWIIAVGVAEFTCYVGICEGEISDTERVREAKVLRQISDITC